MPSHLALSVCVLVVIAIAFGRMSAGPCYMAYLIKHSCMPLLSARLNVPEVLSCPVDQLLGLCNSFLRRALLLLQQLLLLSQAFLHLQLSCFGGVECKDNFLAC